MYSSVLLAFLLLNVLIFFLSFDLNSQILFEFYPLLFFIILLVWRDPLDRYPSTSGESVNTQYNTIPQFPSRIISGGLPQLSISPIRHFTSVLQECIFPSIVVFVSDRKQCFNPKSTHRIAAHSFTDFIQLLPTHDHRVLLGTTAV